MVSGNIKTNIEIDEDYFHTSGSSTPINVEVINSNGISLSGCVSVETFVIKTFPENIQLDECGCPVEICSDAALKITLKKLEPKPIDCSIDSFEFGGDGLILFTINNIQTQYIHEVCCTNLGYTPELGPKGINVCRWRNEVSCDDYKAIINRSGTYVVFNKNDNPEYIFEVPTSSCCPSNSTPELQDNGTYKCFIPSEL